MLNEMEPREARMWALIGVAQHPRLTEEVTGEWFLPSCVSYTIFMAIRELYLSGEEVDSVTIYEKCEECVHVASAMVDLFARVSVSERMARVYVEKLAERSESVV